LSAIQEADVCALVLDANEIATKLDQKIAGMIKDAGRGLIIIVNKWDLVDKDSNTRDRMVAKLQFEMPFVAWAPVIVTSAESGQNVAKLLEIFDEIEKRRAIKLRTKELNTWLQKVTAYHPPAGLKNTHPRLKYVTQTDVNPPRFRFFGRETKYLHWSYKRYLERELRDVEDFSGTPLMLEFSDNQQDNERKGRS
jgi:GTP-binding protein